MCCVVDLYGVLCGGSIWCVVCYWFGWRSRVLVLWALRHVQGCNDRRGQ